jgi:NAD(P)-dependent dehydrogenase (short-subunit alcohol dehydrogenase family)
MFVRCVVAGIIGGWSYDGEPARRSCLFRAMTTNHSSPKNVIVTGGNRGIGYATALALAKRGAHVIITSRDMAKGEQSAQRIRAAVPGADVDVMQLDLAALEDIRVFAAAFLAKGLPLHALINNAGAIGLGAQIQFTQAGFELEFGINHIGHFLLTALLLPALKQAAPGRVISVSSIRHIPGKGGKGAQFDFDNLKGEKGYEPRIFYNNTKLANVWFTHELQRRHGKDGIVAIAACPGFVPQTLGATKTGVSSFFYNRVLMLIPAARTADVSGEELAVLALDPQHEHAGGKFYAGGREMRSSAESYDDAKAARLWEMSEKWTSLQPAATM